MESADDITSEICFIFNPASNSGRRLSSEAEIRALIQQHLPNASLIYSQADRSFWNELPQRVSRCSKLIACGGDGTVHHTGNVAAKTGAALGVIPIGSGNDFAELMDIPLSISDAFNRILAGEVRRIDLIKVGGDLNCVCLNSAGIGLDGRANFYTNIYKRRLGKAGYIAGALRAIIKARSIAMEIRTDSNVIDKQLLMATVCNGRREGGSFWVAPDALPDDGLADVLLLEPTPVSKILKDLPAILRNGRFKRVHASRRRCRSVEVTCAQPACIHVDGEYSDRQVRHVTFNTEPAALTVIV